MKTKLLLLSILFIFIISINFSFAIDDNSTEVVSEIEKDVLNTSNDEIISAEDDDFQNYYNSIKMQGVSKRYNGIIQYKATFLDIDGNPLKNTKVLFEVDDTYDYQPTTDSNGMALLTILITNGNHKLLAYNPSTTFFAQENIKVFDVITGGKNIEMYYDDASTYKVRVFDDNGKPIKAGQKVTFTINKKKVTVKTDKKGYAKLKLIYPPGFYAIIAQYKDFMVENKIFVKPVLKSLTSFKSKSFKPTTKLKIKYLGKSKKNKKIKVKFNKKTYTAKTNKKGIAVFKLKTPKKLGSFPVKVSYKKSNLYLTFVQYI